MTLKELLQNFLPSKEIRVRLINNQVKVNNEIVNDPGFILNVQEGYWRLDDFFWVNRHSESFQRGIKVANVFSNFRNYFGEPYEGFKDLEILTGFTLVSFSKHPCNESYVFINI